uniref:GrpE protein homolog n=1 Tax=Davidia involucrata TaxID=16924 RepID=A0A5B6ZC52_DAVIN
MMAVSLSNNFSLYTPRLSASKSSETLQFKTLTLQFHQLHRSHLRSKPIIGFSLSSPSPIKNRRCFKSSLTLNSTPHTNDEGEVCMDDVKISESEADPKHSSSLKSLMKVYKEAIVYGDEKTMSEIEGMICMVEKEKNELVQKVSSLTAEINSGKEIFIRLQADFDNFRKRSEKEILTRRSDAKGEVIESLLPMVDNFERAKQQIKLETEEEKKIDASYQGIYKQFVEIMRSLHVAAVATVGKPFDPSVHEAIAREESHEFKEGIIIQEFCRGFLLGDRLLRPAMVKVSAGPGKKKPPFATEKSTERPATAAGVDER